MCKRIMRGHNKFIDRGQSRFGLGVDSVRLEKAPCEGDESERVIDCLRALKHARVSKRKPLNRIKRQ